MADLEVARTDQAKLLSAIKDKVANLELYRNDANKALELLQPFMATASYHPVYSALARTLLSGLPATGKNKALRLEVDKLVTAKLGAFSSFVDNKAEQYATTCKRVKRRVRCSAAPAQVKKISQRRVQLEDRISSEVDSASKGQLGQQSISSLINTLVAKIGAIKGLKQ